MLNALGNALRLLTVAPAPYREGVRSDRVAAWFPLVGALLAAIALAMRAVSELIAPFFTLAPLLRGALTVAVLGAVTRGMHWDALADVSDGWWGGATPERRREIASDSSTGAFGVFGVVMVAIVQTIALGAVMGSASIGALPLILALARWSATVSSWWGHPAKSSGLGASLSHRPSVLSVIVAISTIAAAAAFAYVQRGLSLPLLGGLAVLAAVASLLPSLISRRFGGSTGDVMGASILLTETLGFVLLAATGVPA